MEEKFTDSLKSGLSEDEINIWSLPSLRKVFFNDRLNGECMFIDIFVDGDEELKKLYVQSAFEHNIKIYKNPNTYDAGFDMYVPEDISYQQLIDGSKSTLKIDHKIKCRATFPISKLETRITKGTAFYTYARSSVSNTQLRLANNQGIIDAGYRGNLIGKFDVLQHLLTPTSNIQKYSRLLQICSPNLTPIYVNIVNTLEELGDETIRGTGGFGSTGI